MSIENAARARRFRETLWFKRGDAAPPPPAATDLEAAPVDAAVDPIEALPLEDRYRDDGSVTLDDSKLYSLRTGMSQQLPVVPPPVDARGISEHELIGEMRGSRARLVMAIAAVSAILAAAVALAIA